MHNEALGKAGDVCTCLMGLLMSLLWSPICQEPKRCVSDLATATLAAVSLDTVTQKLNKYLFIYIHRYSKIHCVAADKATYKNIDPKQIYNFVVLITDETLQKVFEKVLMLEAGLQLSEAIHLG